MGCKVSWLALTAVALVACGGAGVEEEAPLPVPVGARRAQQAAAQQLQEDASLEREVFSYSGGSRDPFVSLLDQANVGPELADLTLVAVYLDLQNRARNVGVFRDRVTGKRYNVHEGDRLGRAQVLAIREREVSFLVDDFGVERRVTLSLRKAEEDDRP